MPSDWTIRPMSVADVEAAAQLRYDAFFEGSERSLADDVAGLKNLLARDNGEAAFVAVADGEVVGTCLLVANELEPLHDVSPWLAGLIVDKRYRSSGIGGALVRAIEDSARAARIESIYLYTDEAEPFYQRLGWITTDRVVADGETTILMQRTL